MSRPPYQLFPDMPPEQFEALKADIAERGIVTPIDVDEDGNILDGHHRARAWQELQKNEELPTVVRAGLSEDEKRTFARKANVLRRHLTRDQLRELIEQQLRDTPNFANSRIAQSLGVDDKTVASSRERLEATSEIPRFDKLVGADGKARRNPAPRAKSTASKKALDAVDQMAASFGRALGDGATLPEGVQIALFKAGIPAGSVRVMAGSPPLKQRTAEDLTAWRSFIAALVVVAGADDESAYEHVRWLDRNGWTPEAWVSDEGTRYRRLWGMKEPSERFIAAARGDAE